jgi:NAD(P) transhydrogenase subunit alpha
VGAKFVDTGIDARGEGGYARELTAEEKAKAAEVLPRTSRGGHDHHHRQRARPQGTATDQPRADRGHEAGAVIVDMAADSGCNCGRRARAGHGDRPHAGDGPVQRAIEAGPARQRAVRKNLLNLLELIVKDGALAPT